MFSCSRSLFWNKKQVGRGWDLYRCFEVAMNFLFVGCSLITRMCRIGNSTPQSRVEVSRFWNLDMLQTIPTLRDMSTLWCFECVFGRILVILRKEPCFASWLSPFGVLWSYGLLCIFGMVKGDEGVIFPSVEGSLGRIFFECPREIVVDLSQPH